MHATIQPPYIHIHTYINMHINTYIYFQYRGFAVEHLIAVWVESVMESEADGIDVQGVHFSYGGRSSMPSNFDCALATAHGYLAGILIESRVTGVMTSMRDLCQPPTDWRPTGVPLAALLTEPNQRDVVLYGGSSRPMIVAPRLDLIHHAPLSAYLANVAGVNQHTHLHTHTL